MKRKRKEAEEHDAEIAVAEEAGDGEEASGSSSGAPPPEKKRAGRARGKRGKRRPPRGVMTKLVGTGQRPEEEEPDEAAGVGGGAGAAAAPVAHGKQGEMVHVFSSTVAEDHKEAIFFVAFNHLDEKMRNIFASVGSNRATVYQCNEEGGMDVIQQYVDEGKEEVFYAAAWTYDPATGDPLLAIAGVNGIIRLINCVTRTLVKSLLGHGNAINDLRIPANHPTMVISASKDQSARLWNLQTGRCVVIFAGDAGHKDEILSVDFDMHFNRIVTSGMDHNIKIWRLDTERIRTKITESYSVAPTPTPWVAIYEQFPVFSSNKVHHNYVDCVRFVGDNIVSKSLENKLVRWQPTTRRINGKDEPDRIEVLAELKYREAEIWYIRFSMDYYQTMLAVGSITGSVYVFNVDRADGVATQQLVHSKCKATVRHTAISHDGRIIIASCQDGTLWRYDCRA